MNALDNALVSSASMAVDLAPVADAVSRSFEHRIERARIEAVLGSLLASERFAAARVATFVPILLHRAACERLREPTVH
jgi:hypothetical protein